MGGINWSIELDVPANTAKADAKRTTRKIPSGALIDSILLIVPKGHEALVPVTFELEGAQRFPTDGGSYKFDDKELDLIEDSDLLIIRETELAVVAYNLDDTFDHTVYVVVRGRLPNEHNRGF